MEASKNVKYMFLIQRASELQSFEIDVNLTRPGIKSRTPVYTRNFPCVWSSSKCLCQAVGLIGVASTLTGCNSEALSARNIYFKFLETSNLYLFVQRCSIPWLHSNNPKSFLKIGNFVVVYLYWVCIIHVIAQQKNKATGILILQYFLCITLEVKTL